MAGRKRRSRSRTPARRRGPSPALKKARTALASARKTAATYRKQVKEQGSFWAVMLKAASTTAGGGVAGACRAIADEFLGERIGGVVTGGVGLCVTAVGAAAIPGEAGKHVACVGAGMLAKVTGDGTEALTDRLLFGGGDDIEEEAAA